MTSITEKIRLAQQFRHNPPLEVNFETVRKMLDHRVAHSPDAVYLISYDTAGNRIELTYGDFGKRVRTGAALLTSLGVRRGDRVATYAANHAETVVAYFSALYLGACLVPVNMTEDADRRKFIVENSQARVILALHQFTELALSLALEVPAIEHVVQLTGDLFDGVVNWQAAPPVDGDFEAPGAQDESLIVYTSGTTGAPKGVVLLQSNLLADVHTLAVWNQLEAKDRTMCVLPIHHVNGFVVTLLTPMYFGGSTVLNARFHTDHFWERIAKEQVRVVSVVPTLLAFLLERPEFFKPEKVRSLAHIICGAGPLTVELGKAFEDTFGVRILHGYGLSETTCYSSMLPVELTSEQHQHWMRDFGFPSIGVALPGCEMAIHDPNGNLVPHGTRGEIVICGPTVMEGYFNRPDANEAAFTHGWFRSGDEGFSAIDEQGRVFFFITGRIKELIIRGGINLSPFEIDEVLNQIPGVKCGLAVGFENFWYGEEVGAYVVLQEGVTLDEATVLAAARQHLPFHKSPKVVVWGTEIPVTSTGKYQRNRLKPLFEQFKHEQFKEK
ncbi:MAG: acyl--CoA ligase [Acidobacteria bacterium]|nr:acyl--CoA ligase [Acidobacteriota bacterium]